MILDGLKVTLILAIGSLILGTIVGFIFCMLKCSEIKPISTAMTAFIAPIMLRNVERAIAIKNAKNLLEMVGLAEKITK